ncbi:MAG: 2-oxo acid dehydrogenase subunit E2 [Chloroflexi bacterium]|nr:2-oxo acid dehydrogenase subunit E2 [Chloroflexota bacterium]
MTRMRQAIARSMSRSKQEIPHFYVTSAIDMTEAVRLRRQLNDALEEGARVSINDMVIKACAMAILQHRIFNASYTDAGVEVHQRVNIGMAIALDAGLVAPGILDCDRKSLAVIARESKSLAERARSGKLGAAEYTGATFNVTNLGMYGVESFSAIITPPQAAALAVGSVQREPVVTDDQVTIADVMRVTLSIDHRVADGAQGARFVGEIRALLENPVRLLL